MRFFRTAKRVIRWCRAEYLVRKDPVAYARSLGVKIGEGSRIFTPDRAIFGSEPYLVSLGKRCFIAEGVRFVTHDGMIFLFRNRHPELDIVVPIRVGNSVGIGTRAIILPGVAIGNNCIIGAGAVVSHDVPDDSVVVGNPARVVKTVREYESVALSKSVGTGNLVGKAVELRGRFAM